MNTIRIIATLLCLLFSLPTNAADAYSPNFTIIRIWVTAAGDAHIYTNLDEGDYNPAGCTSPNNFAIHKDHASFDRLYSLALGAFYSGKEARVRISDNGCVGNDPKINWFSVYK